MEMRVFNTFFQFSSFSEGAGRRIYDRRVATVGRCHSQLRGARSCLLGFRPQRVRWLDPIEQFMRTIG